jgi:hypothetical protein
MTYIRIPIVLASAVLLAGCAAGGGYGNARKQAPPPQEQLTFVEREVPACAPEETALQCDRRAILSMQGEFKVSFAFDETTVLGPAYERREPQRSGGFEMVVLVEDRERRIDLQHILVMQGHVVKHWRQVWEYEAPAIWTFDGEQRFTVKQRDPATIAGTWTQSVYEVSDAPRYAGSGRWRHEDGVSTWESDLTRRPLPRREYTKRKDYQWLDAYNRHAITPQGWTHEQDNTKVTVGSDGKPRRLVREFGFNDYRRIRGHDFAPGSTYWQETQPFWALMRARWSTALTDPGGLRLGYPVDDEKFIEQVFEAADAYRTSRDETAARASIDALFANGVPAPQPEQAASTAAGNAVGLPVVRSTQTITE